ncbi:hypothetical protein Peur_021365 [Populus x canadensis]
MMGEEMRLARDLGIDRGCGGSSRGEFDSGGGDDAGHRGILYEDGAGNPGNPWFLRNHAQLLYQLSPVSFLRV